MSRSVSVHPVGRFLSSMEVIMKPLRTWHVGMIFSVIFFVALGTAWPNGLNNDEVEFTGAISSLVVNGEDIGTLFIRLSDYDLRVVVNAKTEISDLNGNPIGMGDLKEEARVTITGKYSESGILASRIRLEESPDNDFSVRGKIKSVETSTSGTVLTLLGVQVIVNDTTKIDDGEAALTASSLVPGLQIKAEGTITDEGWVAATITVQSADKGKKKEQVRFEGTVASIDGDTLEVSVEGYLNKTTKVILDTKARIWGELKAGVSVYVIGTLNQDLTVTAREVRVLQAFEIKPDEKKLKVGESATLIVKLRESAAQDTTITLVVSDPQIAALSVSSVQIPKGGTAAEFVVTGGPNTGKTEITAEGLGQKVTATIKVGAVSEGDNENNAGAASIMFAPEHIKMGFNKTRDVLLLIKPPQKTAVTVEFEVHGEFVKVVSSNRLGNGAAAYKVTLQSADKPGSASVVATLPSNLGGGKAELLVDVAAAGPDTSNKPKTKIDFSPREVKLAVGESIEVRLNSTSSISTDVTVALAVTKGKGTITSPPTVILEGGTRSVKVLIKAEAEGKATLTAAMPSEFGGDTASLNVQIKKK